MHVTRNLIINIDRLISNRQVEPYDTTNVMATERSDVEQFGHKDINILHVMQPNLNKMKITNLTLNKQVESGVSRANDLMQQLSSRRLKHGHR